MNTVKLTINTLLVTLILVTTPLANNTAAANSSNEPNFNLNLEMDLQTLVCYVDNIDFSIDVPMPSEWSLDKIEETSMHICNSIQKIETTYPQAVCDTDMHCAHYDNYKTRGVKSIFKAPNYMQNVNETVMEIKCHYNNTTWYTDKYLMLFNMCANTPLDTLNYLKKEAKTNKDYTSDLVVSAEEIQYLINSGWANLNTKHNDAPTTRDFLRIMKKHPEFIASGYFKTSQKPFEKGLTLTQLQAEYIPKTIPSDIINFCQTADDFGTFERYSITRCWWD